ncbi:hypothetical protein EKO23_24480 [Nocardioides guangzhouensis]|uniref:Uncharacterized protein n=1 Tax=Nocardioides guangzhouensis TaxID=2497878 RepID=A0A4Q4Z1F0_9ACTN|nr:hypothetical protein [Nocardioides guangzhouensis]RYP80686.1 hypothetical protein EKO23_24480 [Nocardioides guangzhouensis]
MSDRHAPAPLRPATAVVALAAMAAAAAAGFWLSLTTPELPGTESLTLEDAVDAAALVLFGVLGAVLLVRRRATRLGAALMLMACLVCLTYLFGGLADALADGRVNPPVAARLLNLAGQSTFIVAFFLLALSPMLLFPTGLLPSRRWRPVAWAAAGGLAASVLSVLLKSGPVDEDTPAWGDNPLGLDAMPGLADVLEVVGLSLLAVTVLAGVAAFVTRWVRYRGPRRRQMAWFSLGVVVQVGGLATDTSGKSLLLEVLLALTIFSGLLWGIGWPLLGPLGDRAEEADRLTVARSEVEGGVHA